MQDLVVGRRRFLDAAAGATLGLASWLSAGCAGDGASPSAPAGAPTPNEVPPVDPDRAPVLPPRVNGGINLQPVRTLGRSGAVSVDAIEPELVVLQLKAVYELGFDAIRITAPHGDRANFLAAIPYVRGARALGIDALVVVSSFSGFTAPRVLWDPRQRPGVLRLYNEIFVTPPAPAGSPGGTGPDRVGEASLQILNEPVSSFDVPPDVYVREILGPCYVEQGRIDPLVTIVSAAAVGSPRGVPRIRAMLDAGLEDACDRIAYHVYDREVIPLLSPNVRGYVWITESGVAGTALHLPWVRDTFAEIRVVIPDVTRIFYFQLFDTEAGRFRLIDIQPDDGAYRSVVESTGLVGYLGGRVRAAAGPAPLVPFEDLVPDVRAYFPTPADVEAHDEVLFG